MVFYGIRYFLLLFFSLTYLVPFCPPTYYFIKITCKNPYNSNPIYGDMRGYLELIRPLNCVMVSIAVFIGAGIGVGLSVFDEIYMLKVLLACFVAFLFTGAGNALNDYYDRDIDKINHPRRPIPCGKVSPKNTIRFSVLLFIGAIILTLYINLYAILILATNLAIMISYEVFSKAKGVAGNATISWLTATTFLFGGAAVEALTAPLILSSLAFLATFGREIAKDIEDIRGDTGRVTLPMNLGIDGAAIIASLAIVSAVLLSPTPYLLGLFSESSAMFYIIFVVLADIIFIYSICLLLKRKKKTSGTIKYAMLIALVAFLVGGLGLF